jgi:hypothetical protein
MHNEIDYSQYANPGEKRQAALKDIKNWLGIRKYNEVSKLARQEQTSFRHFEFACSIAGIQGYPVVAWAEELGIEVPSEDTNKQDGAD